MVVSAVTHPGNIPKPRDPRRPQLTAEEITQQVELILGETVGSLEEEVDQLTRAHAVLHAALQREA